MERPELNYTTIGRFYLSLGMYFLFISLIIVGYTFIFN